MQEAFQEYTDCSISKTINLPNSASISDVEEVYKYAFNSNLLKGLTVYRDGSRQNQPMQLGGYTNKKGLNDKQLRLLDFAKRLEGNRSIYLAVKIKQKTPFGALHITLVLDNDLNETEVFAQLGKSGDIAGADLEAICRLSSKLLKSNYGLDNLIKQLIDIGTSVTLPTGEGRIVSLPDGLAKALNSYNEIKLKVLDQKEKEVNTVDNSTLYKMKCPSCESGNIVFSEGCRHCDTCEYELC
jgi:ribonucleoside-diphosphate reductase alpha chain